MCTGGGRGAAGRRGGEARGADTGTGEGRDGSRGIDSGLRPSDRATARPSDPVQRARGRAGGA